MKEIKIPLPEKQDFDGFLMEILKFFLDSEAKSKIYLYLRNSGQAISKDIAKGANLYPSSTREALADMTKNGVVLRTKLDVEGTGKKPFVYEAISPTELLKKRASKIEEGISRLLNLGGREEGSKKEKPLRHPKAPYRIRIEKVVDDEGKELVVVETNVEKDNKDKSTVK